MENMAIGEYPNNGGQYNYYTYPNYTTEVTEVVEETYDENGKLISKKKTTTTRTYPRNNWTVQY